MEILSEIIAVFTVINNISPMGVVALVIIGYVILPKIKWFTKTFNVCKNEDVRPVLLRMTESIEKISGNDLTHLKDDIRSMGDKLQSIDERFITHDQQAKAILNRVNDVWAEVKK
jgi:hypothetical protein